MSKVRKASILGGWLIIENQCLRIVRRAFPQRSDTYTRFISEVRWNRK